MKLKKIYVENDDQGPMPPPDDNGPGLLDRLRDCFDDATLPMRRRISAQVRETMFELDRGEMPSLSALHRAAVMNRLVHLRIRINAGGVGGLVSTGRAVILQAHLNQFRSRLV